MSDDFQHLLNDSFRFLSFRPRSIHEVTAYLEKRAKIKKIDPEIAVQVLSRLEEMDYINDEKFAHEWVESRSKGRGLGSIKLRAELKRKGIAKDIIDRQIPSNTQGSEAQYSIAKQTLEKRVIRWRRLPHLVFKRKVYDFLLRRGFPSSVALRLIDEYATKAYNTGCENND